tara:strand:+ start:819 stop:1211 length:393 start_codon:yes stop_codon:yes gene_type:complete
MNMAEELALLSYAKRKQVGCLVVRGDEIITNGVNGTLPGLSNACEYYNYHKEEFVTKEETLHAEATAICKLAGSTNSCHGATVYVTLVPCSRCAVLLARAKIVRVVYKEHREENGLDLLELAGISYEQLS